MKNKLLFIAVILLFFNLTLITGQEDNQINSLLIKITNESFQFKTTTGLVKTKLSGQISYSLIPTNQGIIPEMKAINLTGYGVKTRSGESGNISINLDVNSAKTEYEQKNNLIITNCFVEMHYPLIDKLKGFKRIIAHEKETDIYESFTEIFQANLKIQLRDKLQLSGQKESKEGAKIELNLNAYEKITGEVISATAVMEIVDVVFIPLFLFKRWINIQPVFIRYTPSTGCSLGGTWASTGGSYPILRERAVEMWDRCCIGLNFLPPVYIYNNDYRILSSAEETGLRASYDDPDAVEVFFAEVGDPLGIHGGGVCFSIGTANTQVITYDTNLPINLYNLAHELGHSLDLLHPPGNSTVGSLLEPSGFCLDNPPLMSLENCNNASNPLLYYPTPFQFCSKNPNM